MRSAIILQTINHQEGILGGKQNMLCNVHDKYLYFYWKYQTQSINHINSILSLHMPLFRSIQNFKNSWRLEGLDPEQWVNQVLRLCSDLEAALALLLPLQVVLLKSSLQLLTLLIFSVTEARLDPPPCQLRVLQRRKQLLYLHHLRPEHVGDVVGQDPCGFATGCLFVPLDQCSILSVLSDRLFKDRVWEGSRIPL